MFLLVVAINMLLLMVVSDQRVCSIVELLLAGELEAVRVISSAGVLSATGKLKGQFYSKFAQRQAANAAISSIYYALLQAPVTIYYFYIY